MTEVQISELQKVLRLQEALIAEIRQAGHEFTVGNTDDVCPVKHHFAPGMYAREMLIPKGTVIVGKMHRHDHLVSMVGCIAIAGEGEPKVVSGPVTFRSEAFTKRAGVALEDTIWTTYHATDKTDPEEIELDVIVPEAKVLEMARMEALA